MKRKITQIILLVLCVFILLSNSSVAYCSQFVDNSETSSYTEFVNGKYDLYMSNSVSSSQTSPQGTNTSAIIKTPFIIVLVRETPGFLGRVKTVFFVAMKVKIISTPIFGGVSDERKNNHQESETTLYINAICIFGGIEIKW